MQVNMKEVFKAKGIDIDTLPIVTKSASGSREHIVFKGGIVAKLSRGKGVVGERCVWIPESAKYVNKILGDKVLNTSPVNLTTQNNNCNTIIFERFGDVRVMWTVPITYKIINQLMDGLTSKYGMGQYVGHTLILTVVDLGHVDEVVKLDNYPDMISTKMTDNEVDKILKDHFGYLETAIEIEFLHLLNHRLKSKFLGFDNFSHYFQTTEDHLIKLTIIKMDGVEELRNRLSHTTLGIINDYKTQRL